MSDSGKKAANAAQLRLLQVIEILSGNEVFGMRLVDVHAALKSAGTERTVSTVLHDLEALEAGGWAQQTADVKWRLAAKPFQILANLQFGLQGSAAKLSEVENRYTRLT